MKKIPKLSFDKVFICVLFLLIAINSVGIFIENTLILKIAIPICIPIFIIFFYLKFNTLGFCFISFLTFSFLGDIANMFFIGENLLQASSLLYIISYIFLLILVAPNFKLLEIKVLIGVYLLIVLSISLYFLAVTYNMIQAVIANSYEVLLFGIKSFILIILCLMAFAVYLNSQTKQSILYLTAILFFGLSVILNNINLYYLYNWSFDLIHRILYILALFVMFKYIMSLNFTKKSKNLKINEKDNYSSNAIFS